MQTLNVGELYPVAPGESAPSGRAKARVRATGETRCPRAGEWYLSGAVIEGYRAKTALSTEYPIGVLVQGRLAWQES
ncbi:hypothetical protein I0C86_41270 [Plantactinospora sp. S1510]|uniref:Uncharacterized protein n=1 Tax=Plantactinospora alkalitolerans TaxID=2789879 RepID=A0ABS0HAC6_9ACTN|nr:hypothetical protein [Plantactinospora alkalitolerans]MBF9135284.1 hypothetical protein [Plantactinospora alkalitolerans]